MHILKKCKIICEITHATGKYSQGLMGPAISEGSFKSTKKIYLSCLDMESFTSIDKCAVDLRVICIAYLIGQSLLNILSQIPALKVMQKKVMGVNVRKYL